MHRLSKITVWNGDYNCLPISQIGVSCSLLFVDDETNESILIEIPKIYGLYNKGKLYELLKNYGIFDFYGVVDDFLVAFSADEVRLLDYLDWDGYVNRDISAPNVYLTRCMFDSSNLIYTYGALYYSITYILRNISESYVIRGNYLIINIMESRLPRYKISDVTKFNRLLTKLVVLER